MWTRSRCATGKWLSFHFDHKRLMAINSSQTLNSLHGQRVWRKTSHLHTTILPDHELATGPSPPGINCNRLLAFECTMQPTPVALSPCKCCCHSIKSLRAWSVCLRNHCKFVSQRVLRSNQSASRVYWDRASIDTP